MATLTVGAGQQYVTIAAAIAATNDGDTVLVNAGTYVNDFATIYHKITLQSVGGLAVLQAAQSPSNGKAILTTETDVTIDGFGFTGATVPDNNGAGIRYEGGNLVVRNSVFWNNQDGILGNTDKNGSVLIQSSEFSHNGAGDGYSHGIYINDVKSLVIQDSYFHDAQVGHEIKSRAESTTITGTRIFDNTGGTASYSVDLPNGGVAVLSNDIVEKGANTQNPYSIHFGGEGLPYAANSLSITGTTFVDDRPGATLLANQTAVVVGLANDSLYNFPAGNVAVGPVAITGNTTLSTRPTLDTTSRVPGAAAPVATVPGFDPSYYLAHNPDVAAAGVDPLQHFLTFGWHEGRNPSAVFDTNWYLAQNPDVAAAAGLDPLLHYDKFGWKEGRDPSLVFSTTKYEAVHPVAGGANPLDQYLVQGRAAGFAPLPSGGIAAADPLVDPAYYDRQLSATLLPAGLAGQQQAAFLNAASGWQRGLSPDAFFDTGYYLSHNPDVAAAHVNPLIHYEQHGWKEGRDPSAQFSTNKYLAAYADVKAVGIDPLLHYVEFDQSEGRTAFAA